MNRKTHWDAVYESRPADRLTWHEAHPEFSLALIRRHLRPGGAVVDIGAGASHLVDHLLAEVENPVTLLDVSREALALTRARLGERASRVDWLTTDVTRWQPAQTYALWHDRAVFHFLNDASARAGYLAALVRALVPGGVAIIATFAEDGPETCSGLPVVRYSPAGLLAEVAHHAAGVFLLSESHYHQHVTPTGGSQSFQTSVLTRRGPGN